MYLKEDAVGYYSRIKHAEKGTEVIVLDERDPVLVESNGKRFHVKKAFLTDIKPEENEPSIKSRPKR